MTGHTTRKVGEALPVVLVTSDLAELLGLSIDRIYQLEKTGELDAFELKPRLGKRRRYSGSKVQAWLDGPAAAEPAAAPSRYFQKARR